jgi:hypothetical protein
MADNIARGQQAAQELTQRWMATMQSIALRSKGSSRSSSKPPYPTIDGASSTTAADLPADVPTVDGASPGPTAGFPTDGSAVALNLHGPL